jgi:hypothetical protein
MSEMVTVGRDLDERVRFAIRSADRARLELAALDLSRVDRISRPLYAADLAALWDRMRVTLSELQLQPSPAREE